MFASICVAALLHSRLAAALSVAQARHQPKEVLAAADAIWGQAVPEGIPHAVVDDSTLFDRISDAVRATVKEADTSAVSLVEKPPSQKPGVTILWRARAFENGTAGVMKMDHGCKHMPDGATACNIDVDAEGGYDQKVHIRLHTGRKLREGDVFITTIKMNTLGGGSQEMEFTCPACSFPCQIPMPGGPVKVDMPPCPILAGVYDLSLPVSAIPLMDTIQNITANTIAMHAGGQPAFNLVSFLRLRL